MAKGSTSNAPTTKRGDARLSPIIAGLDLYYPILVDCNLDWSPESADDEKPERFYDTAIRTIDDSVKDKITIASCEFSAGEKTRKTKSFEIRATYLIAVSHTGGHDILSKSDRKKILEEAASTSAWPLFRALYANMASQTNLQLPLLPNIPKLRWLRPGKSSAKEDEEKSD